jgi:hypothetical protein
VQKPGCRLRQPGERKYELGWNVVIVRYLCKTLYPGEYGIARLGTAPRLAPFFEQRGVPSYHQAQYRLADRTFERSDVMPSDDGFNRRKRSLYFAGGA